MPRCDFNQLEGVIIVLQIGMLLGLEDSCDYIFRIRRKLGEYEFFEDVGIVDEILCKLFHLLLEGLLIRLALEFISLLED